MEAKTIKINLDIQKLLKLCTRRISDFDPKISDFCWKYIYFFLRQAFFHFFAPSLGLMKTSFRLRIIIKYR
jgi:hypothetical protein